MRIGLGQIDCAVGDVAANVATIVDVIAHAAGRGGDAAVLVNATAWPQVRGSHWDVLTRSRAVENQAYFVGVARVGEDAGIRFAGRSRVVSPTGEVSAEASATEPAWRVAERDPAAVAVFRSAVPALAVRRRDLFG